MGNWLPGFWGSVVLTYSTYHSPVLQCSSWLRSFLAPPSSVSPETCEKGPRSMLMSVKDQKAQAYDLLKATARNTET